MSYIYYKFKHIGSRFTLKVNNLRDELTEMFSIQLKKMSANIAPNNPCEPDNPLYFIKYWHILSNKLLYQDEY